MDLTYDDAYGIAGSPDKHNLKTGGQIPVAIIAEVDRKVDDGSPYYRRISVLRVSGKWQHSADRE